MSAYPERLPFQSRTSSLSLSPWPPPRPRRCLLSAPGISGSGYVDAGDRGAYYAACVRTPRTEFALMGYSLRTRLWRYTYWAHWQPSMHPNLTHPAGEELYDHRNDTSRLDLDRFEYPQYLADDPQYPQYPQYAAVKVIAREKYKGGVWVNEAGRDGEDSEIES